MSYCDEVIGRVSERWDGLSPEQRSEEFAKESHDIACNRRDGDAEEYSAANARLLEMMAGDTQ